MSFYQLLQCKHDAIQDLFINCCNACMLWTALVFYLISFNANNPWFKQYMPPFCDKCIHLNQTSDTNKYFFCRNIYYNAPSVIFFFCNKLFFSPFLLIKMVNSLQMYPFPVNWFFPHCKILQILLHLYRNILHNLNRETEKVIIYLLVMATCVFVIFFLKKETIL